MAKSLEAKVLGKLKEHMTGIIYVHEDMAVREAKLWEALIANAPTLSHARYYGFTHIRSIRDLVRTRLILQRFIRIFGKEV
jgi:hypothetical protein